ncbi:MAG TPA: hypothetical protein VFP99_02935 [Chthoniobacterales bacterium]|nr:hypothetical protein [Chthoniobacterales bacterium]
MKASILCATLGCLLLLAVPGHAQETPKFEKIRDLSPDKKFAARISCSSEPEDPENIDSNLITAIDIVSLPAKEVVASLGSGEGLESFKLVWSSDSNWFAFPFSEGHRVTLTNVYNLHGNKFEALNTEELRADVKGDVRNEYIKPLRWMKPGTLLLEQYDIFRGGNGDDATFQFTVRFEKDGKFHVLSKKKVPTKPE